MATAATMPQGGFMSGDSTTNVRESIVPRDVSAALQSFPQERSDATLQLIHDWLLHIPHNCRRFFNLGAPKANVRYLCKQLKLLAPSRGTLIYRQGDVGDKFYVILEGVCEVLHTPIHNSATSPSSRKLGETGGSGVIVRDEKERRALGCRVGVLPAGECFGENSIGQERDACVISNGAEVGGAVYPALILQVDGKAYRRCIRVMFQGVEAVLRKRVLALSRLHLFADWPRQEVEFFSYWMKDAVFPEHSVVYNAGDPVTHVYFVMEGIVEVSTKIDKRPGEDFVIESVIAPAFFGEMEVLDHAPKRTYKATVSDTGPCVVSVMPVNVFWRLICSELPMAAYESAKKLEKVMTSRQSWHQLRLDDVDDTGDVNHKLLHEIQTRFLGCPLCGEMNHMVEDCAMNENASRAGSAADGQTAAQEEATAAAAAAAAAAVAAVGGGAAGSNNGTPRSGLSVKTPVGGGASLLAQRALTPRFDSPRTGTPGSRPGSGLSVGSAGSGGSRRRRAGSPKVDVDGDDWNDVKAAKVDDKLSSEVQKGLQEAKADIRMVLKAVAAFKRLVARKRAERAAAAAATEEGVDGEGKKLRRKSSTQDTLEAARKEVAASHSGSGAGGGAGARRPGAGIKLVSLHAPSPRRDDKDIISGTLERPSLSESGSFRFRRSKSMPVEGASSRAGSKHNMFMKRRQASMDGLASASRSPSNSPLPRLGKGSKSRRQIKSTSPTSRSSPSRRAKSVLASGSSSGQKSARGSKQRTSTSVLVGQTASPM